MTPAELALREEGVHVEEIRGRLHAMSSFADSWVNKSEERHTAVANLGKALQVPVGARGRTDACELGRRSGCRWQVGTARTCWGSKSGCWSVVKTGPLLGGPWSCIGLALYLAWTLKHSTSV